MKEFFNMGGYAFYVWASFGVFFVALIFDYFQLKVKQKNIYRQINSFLKRKKGR